MAFSRNNLLAAVAGTVSVAMLAGCPQAPGQVGPSAAPTAAPTTTPSDAATPSPVASKSPLESTTVRGNVYDEAGSLLNASKVRIESLNPSNPFDTTVDVVSGAYVANNVPAGVQLRLTATKDGYTPRVRVETLLPLSSSQSQTVNFGSTSGSNTNTSAYENNTDAGKAYFLSDTPEVASVEPADKATGVDPTKVSLKLTLSEPLESDQRTAFGRAIRLTNIADNTATNQFEDSVLAADTLPGTTTADADEAIVGVGSTFNDDANNPVSVTWDAEGKVATLAFNAPVQTSDDSKGVRYFVYLASSASSVTDADGNGFVQASAFRVGEENRAYSYYNVASDSTKPTLESVSVDTVGSNSRLVLTFSEPLAAYKGTLTSTGNATVSTQLTATTDVRLSLAKNVGDLATDSELNDADGAAASADDFDALANAAAAVDGSAYNLSGFTLDANADRAVGEYYFNSTNPKIVYFTLNGKVASTIANVKVWVGEGVKDPAGNAADEASKSGTL